MPEISLAAMTDGRCFCDRCESRTKDIYRMVGRCLNCHVEPILMLYRAGDPAVKLDCPRCGFWGGVDPQRMATPDEIPAALNDGRDDA
jgi:hypothetical protein